MRQPTRPASAPSNHGEAPRPAGYFDTISACSACDEQKVWMAFGKGQVTTVASSSVRPVGCIAPAPRPFCRCRGPAAKPNPTTKLSHATFTAARSQPVLRSRRRWVGPIAGSGQGDLAPSRSRFMVGSRRSAFAMSTSSASLSHSPRFVPNHFFLLSFQSSFPCMRPQRCQ